MEKTYSKEYNENSLISPIGCGIDIHGISTERVYDLLWISKDLDIAEHFDV